MVTVERFPSESYDYFARFAWTFVFGVVEAADSVGAVATAASLRCRRRRHRGFQ